MIDFAKILKQNFFNISISSFTAIVITPLSELHWLYHLIILLLFCISQTIDSSGDEKSGWLRTYHMLDFGFSFLIKKEWFDTVDLNCWLKHNSFI